VNWETTGIRGPKSGRGSRDLLLRIAHEPDVKKLTPRGWKQHFAAQVQAHQHAILERIVKALA
jgi:hypothetical protein